MKPKTDFDRACEAEAQKVQDLHELQNDKEAMQALRYLASKYTSEQIIDLYMELWWKRIREE